MAKLICKKEVYKGNKDEFKGKTFTSFYIESENGMLIQIKPSFDNDYRSLEALSVRE